MYEIVVRGRLPSDWDQWFDQFASDVTTTAEGPVTTLVGPVRDQAALHGVLARIRDIALPVISITLLAEPDQSATNTPATTPPDT